VGDEDLEGLRGFACGEAQRAEDRVEVRARGGRAVRGGEVNRRVARVEAARARHSHVEATRALADGRRRGREREGRRGALRLDRADVYEGVDETREARAALVGGEVVGRREHGVIAALDGRAAGPRAVRAR